MKRGFIVKAGLMFVSVWMAVGTAVMAQDLGPSGAFKVTLDDAIRVALTDQR